MPSTRVLDILPTWTSITGETLRRLTIICKASTHVTDALLAHLAPNLQGLECLYIIGCPRVTHAGIMAIASASTSGLIEISLEALSQEFDMSAFKTACLRINALRRLRAITLTVHINMPLAEWTRDVEELLSSAPLEVFSIYSTTKTIWTPILDEFWDGIVTKHGQRLRRISIHRMQIGLAALELICSQCPLLEQLFIVTEENELDDVAQLFALAKNLRTVHINLSMATSQSLPMLMQIATSILAVCPPITHIGCNTRAWQVNRIVREDEKGEKYVLPTLAPQESPGIPEQFLVVRA
ncbi:hypothetical protein JVU11DRAFT_12108 [Chiua virens]|nr:hypothetical protein JVU11DRAFT_12108 [Chiua virens]